MLNFVLVSFVFAAAILLPTITADDDVTATDTDAGVVDIGRMEGCHDVIDYTIQCPVDSYPLAAQIHESDPANLDEFRKILLEGQLKYGVEKTCGEYRSFLGCLTNMITEAKKQCLDVASDYGVHEEIQFHVTKMTLGAILTMCDEHHDLLSENFECLNDFDLSTRIQGCGGRLRYETEIDVQCFMNELKKTTSCKENAAVAFKLVLQLFQEESAKNTAWLNTFLSTQVAKE